MLPNQTSPQGGGPRDWKWHICYYNKFDPRVIVPKRWRWMGWTLNFAHPSAIPVALLLVGACLGIPLLLALRSGGGPTVTLIALGIGTAILCLSCAYLSAGPDDDSGKNP